MMTKTSGIWVLTITLSSIGGGVAQAAEQKVTLMLGGKFCEAYLGDVRDALTKIGGVKDVDFKSLKGHAIVTVEGDKTKPQQLVQAVNGVKGDGWHCTAQVMK